MELGYDRTSEHPSASQQPTLSGFEDQVFDCSGWKIKSASTGTLDQKVYDKRGTDLDTPPKTVTTVVNQWLMKRQSPQSAIKSFIPLLILLFLSWYTSFLDVGDATTAVGLNTTVFLAGIALYFSADRPRSRTLTIIDKFFVAFYLSIALLLISEFSIFISEEVYSMFHVFWQILLPILVLSSVVFLFYKSGDKDI